MSGVASLAKKRKPKQQSQSRNNSSKQLPKQKQSSNNAAQATKQKAFRLLQKFSASSAVYSEATNRLAKVRRQALDVLLNPKAAGQMVLDSVRHDAQKTKRNLLSKLKDNRNSLSKKLKREKAPTSRAYVGGGGPSNRPKPKPAPRHHTPKPAPRPAPVPRKPTTKVNPEYGKRNEWNRGQAIRAASEFDTGSYYDSQHDTQGAKDAAKIIAELKRQNR